MGKRELKKALPRIWYRARAEDTDEEIVYRPARSYDDIPPSRAPEVFTLKPDGTLIEGVVEPTDQVSEVQGTWKLDGDRLLFYTESARAPSRVMRIASADDSRLVVKK